MAHQIFSNWKLIKSSQKQNLVVSEEVKFVQVYLVESNYESAEFVFLMLKNCGL